MTWETLLVGLSVLVALVGGYFVARRSNEVEAIRGGALALLCNYLVSASMIGLVFALWFTVIVTIITPPNLFSTFARYALVNLILILAALLVYGIVEPDAPAAD